MPVARLLLAAFIVVPLAEMYVLISVGGVIGALPTIALVVLTAAVGAALIRAQGLATLARVQAALGRDELPALELLEGACLLVAGALLLTPGFITDALGFLLLIPALRRRALLKLLERGVLRGEIQRPDGRGGRSPGGRVIEGEYRREDG